MAVWGPQAAIIEAHDIIKPVGIPWHPWGFNVGWRAPVVSPVWGASTNWVSSQHQSTCAVIAALLPWSMDRTINNKTKITIKRKKAYFNFTFLKTWFFFIMPRLPGMNCSDTVDTTLVVSAHTPPLNVTTIISLKQQNGWKINNNDRCKSLTGLDNVTLAVHYKGTNQPDWQFNWTRLEIFSKRQENKIQNPPLLSF